MTMTTLPKEGEYYQPSQQQNSVPLVSTADTCINVIICISMMV